MHDLGSLRPDPKSFTLMRLRSRTHLLEALALALLLMVACAGSAFAQGDEPDELSDDAADPIKLFNRGQDAHAKKEYEEALEFYERALKLRPEFPEAEYQRAGALWLLKRFPEAEKSYQRAATLLPSWPLPPATLGLLLARTNGRANDAEVALRRSLELDVKNQLGAKKVQVVAALADLRVRAGDARGALSLWQQATALDPRDATLWVARGSIERTLRDDTAALKSFTRALEIDSANAEARLRRAEMLFEGGEKERAIEDARAVEGSLGTDTKLRLLLANLYGRLGLANDARRVLDALPPEARNSADSQSVLQRLEASCEDTPEAIANLEKLAQREPRNASVLACLGGLYRTSEPAKSLDYFKRAVEIEPRNVDYATGYGAALRQLKRLPEAAAVLESVLKVAPDHYAAHTNFATALYDLKLYKRAIEEYKWINRARPELGVVYYWIATAHDHLGEYTEALEAYETFLARADAATNKLEIEKVNLRLPSLRRQLERGEGVKSERKNRQ
jgi:tetratricopeptide (TPR) repeat protein